MNKTIYAFCAFFATMFSPVSYAGTFTSNGTGGGSWNTSATWVFSGDADGIPDPDDNVTILSGDAVTWSTHSSVNNLTVNAGAVFTAGAATYILTVYGNYNMNGTETGAGTYEFRSPGTLVGGAGSHSVNSRWVFSNSRTIQANVTATKNFYIRVYGGSTVVTNLGNLTLYCISSMTTGATWVQGTNSTLRVKNLPVMNAPSTGNLDAGTNVNTVILDYTVNQAVPPTVANTYHNLRLFDGTRRAYTINDLVVRNVFYLGLNSIFTCNHNLTIGGNFSQFGTSGSFLQAPGTTVTFNGSGAQSLSSQTNIIFQNLAVNKSAGSLVFTSARTYNVLESLALISGNLNITATVNLTLVSNSTQTAVIAPSMAGSLTGGNKFRAERFIEARAAGYSDMAGSMQGQTLADWNDDLLLVYAYSPPYAYPSVFGYSESGFDYVPITSSSQPLTPGMGFEVYLDSDGNQTTFNSTTLDNTGTPNLGSFDISPFITFDNDGWNLVGNPYHANISWDALHATTTDVSADIMFYDETIEDFTTVSTGSGALIAPEQGFWINSLGAASLTFTENIKSPSLSSNFRSTPEKLFALRLKSVAGTRFTSGTSFRFAQDPTEAVKGHLPFKGLPHPDAPTLASVSEAGKPLKINLLNSSSTEINVPLNFSVGTDGLYTIEAQNLEALQFESYTCAVLTDNKTGQSVNLVSENYQFYAEKGESSNRFSLKLTKNSDCGSPSIEVAGGQVDINRLGENTVVKFAFDSEIPVQITMTDLLGQQLVPAQNLHVQQQTVQLPMPQNFSGIYLVNVFYGNRVESKKLFR